VYRTDGEGIAKPKRRQPRRPELLDKVIEPAAGIVKVAEETAVVIKKMISDSD
jgi:hypothetical protein